MKKNYKNIVNFFAFFSLFFLILGVLNVSAFSQGVCRIKDIYYKDILDWKGTCLDSHAFQLLFSDGSCADHVGSSLVIEDVCNIESHGKYDCLTCNSVDCRQAKYAKTGSRIYYKTSSRCGDYEDFSCKSNLDCVMKFGSEYHCDIPNHHCEKNPSCKDGYHLSDSKKSCIPDGSPKTLVGEKSDLSFVKEGDSCVVGNRCPLGMECTRLYPYGNRVSSDVCLEKGSKNSYCQADSDCDFPLRCREVVGYYIEDQFGKLPQDVTKRCVLIGSNPYSSVKDWNEKVSEEYKENLRIENLANCKYQCSNKYGRKTNTVSERLFSWLSGDSGRESECIKECEKRFGDNKLGLFSDFFASFFHLITFGLFR